MKILKLKKQGILYRFKVSPEILGCCSLFLFLCGDLVWSVIFHAGKIVGLGDDDRAIFVAIQSMITFFPVFLSAVMYHKIRKTGFFILLPLCLLLFLLSAEIHPEYRTWIFAGNWDIWTCIFAPSCGLYAFLYIQSIKKCDSLFKTVYIATWFNFAYALVRFMRVLMVGTIVTFKSIGQTHIIDYDMTLGYMVAFGAVVFLYKCVDKFNILDFGGLLFSIVIIVFGGSRGAFGLLILAFLFIGFEFREKLLNNKFFVTFSILCIGLIIIGGISIKEIQAFLLNMLEKYDIHSRTLTMLISGHIADDNGRNAINDAAIQLIKTGGIFGHGVYGDRYVLVKVQDAGYPHNICLEMAAQFGVAFAVTILTIISALVIATFFNSKDKNFRIVYLAFLISSGKLIMSDSFWYNKYFWGLLGLTVMYWRILHTGEKQGL